MPGKGKIRIKNVIWTLYKDKMMKKVLSLFQIVTFLEKILSLFRIKTKVIKSLILNITITFWVIVTTLIVGKQLY